MITACLALCCVAWRSPQGEAHPPPPPTLFLIGDSTVKNHTAGQLGWGDPFAKRFDPAKLNVVNRARGGRSSRTFFTEGLWAKVAADLKPGDFVLMQFGHNDSGSLTASRGRASIKGNGDDTVDVANPAGGSAEAVHSYGWYLRQYVRDTQRHGARAIVLSPVPRKIWKNDHTVARAAGDYGLWARQAAAQTGAAFVDLNELVAKRYEALGQKRVEELFGDPHTHTNAAGAELNAEVVVSGLRKLRGYPFRAMLARPDLGP